MKNILIIFSFAFFLTLAGCNDSHQKKQRQQHNLPTVAAEIIKPVTIAAPHNLELTATITAVQRADIAARISGNIISLPVTVGQKVEKEELLAELDSSNFTAAVREAEVALNQAQRNLARESRLLKKHAATAESVKNLKDISAMAEARLSQAKTMLGYTKIYAPFSGVINSKLVNSGDLAVPGRPLLILENPKQMQVEVDIPESLLKTVTVAQKLPVRIPSVNLALSAIVTEISPALDPAARTARAKLTLPAESTKNIQLYSGMFALVDINKSTGNSASEKSLTIPTRALQPWGQLDRVFVLEDNHAALRLVRTGARLKSKGKEMVEILSGLEGDEQLLVSNTPLQHGQPVEIKKQQ